MEEMTAVQSSIVVAVERGILPSYANEYAIVPYDHNLKTYTTSSITMPLTWHLVNGVWIARAGRYVLVDERA